MTIDAQTVVAAASQQVSSEVGGETVVLELERGVYYGLQGVGPRVWELLREPGTVASIRDALVAEFEVEPDRCERDLLDLLDTMVARGLVEVRGGQAP